MTSDVVVSYSTRGKAGAEEQSALWQRYWQEGYGYERPRRGDIVTGTILQGRPRAVIVNIGVKRDGLVPADDLQRLDHESVSHLQIGCEVPVFVERVRDRHGDLVLSISRGMELQDWKEAQRLLESGEIVELQAQSCNRGGLIVPFGQLDGFVPGSHLRGIARGLGPEQRRHAFASQVGRTLRLKVIEVNRYRRRLVLSHREAERAYGEQRKEELLQTLNVGDVVTGRVTALRQFGAFVDVGGADGLVHISEISYEHVQHPREVLEVGQEAEVYVLRLDQERKRIGLSMKQLLPDPWEDSSPATIQVSWWR